MPRRFLFPILVFLVIGGYASGFASLAHRAHHRHGWSDGRCGSWSERSASAPADSQGSASAPAPRPAAAPATSAAPAQAPGPQIFLIEVPATPAAPNYAVPQFLVPLQVHPAPAPSAEPRQP